jgi:hypothetical protein
LIGIGWGQDERKNLYNDLDIIIKHNKAIEKEVKNKIEAGYAHKFSSERDEQIKKEKLTSLTHNTADGVLDKIQNLDIHCKDKSKRKLVNAIQITGVILSEQDIEQKTEKAKHQLVELKDIGSSRNWKKRSWS